MTQTVVIVSLGRASARGERRRVASWRAIFEMAGCQVTEIKLLERCRTWCRPGQKTLRDLIRGQRVLESLSWSPARLEVLLGAIDPSLVICVTARSFHPRLATRPVVLDFVDRLSANYTERSDLVRGARRFGLRVLASSNRHFERMPHQVSAATAAGSADATVLGVTHVPNVVEPAGHQPLTPDALIEEVDLLFTGTLTYAPNIDALVALDEAWAAIQATRPGTTLRVAGANPPSQVIDLATRNGWQLLSDFDSAEAVHAGAKVAVAPLRRATGIQTKVLDAAYYGVPQVISPAAAAGLPAGFPGVIAAEADFVEQVTALLADAHERRRIAEATVQWVQTTCDVKKWATWAATIEPLCQPEEPCLV